jgi:hypothetical protein
VKTKIDLEKTTANLNETTDKAVNDLTVKLNGISLLYIAKFEGINPKVKIGFV